ncbi:MAG: cyclic nucleotide-binding domain-containing protein [Nitrospirota bacterium]
MIWGKKESRETIHETFLNNMRKGKWKNAIDEMKKLIAMESENAMFHLRLGDIYSRINELTNAVKSYFTAGELFEKKGFAIKAITTYKMILKLDPASGDATRKLSILCGQPELAAMVATPKAGEELVTKLSLFTDFSEDDITSLYKTMIQRKVTAGTPIIREGEYGDSIYIIKQGKVSVTTSFDDKEIQLAILIENDFFGEGSVLTGKPRIATVTAETECEIFELKKEVLEGLIKKYPRMWEILYGVFETRMQDTASKITQI